MIVMFKFIIIIKVSAIMVTMEAKCASLRSLCYILNHLNCYS